MLKPVSIILIFIFSFCLFATGAFGYTDCESNCFCKSAMSKPEQASHAVDASKKTSLQMSLGCCAGSTADSCGFTRETAESLLKTFPANVRSEALDCSGQGLTSINLLIEAALPKIHVWGPDLRLKTKPHPIYLQINTFLC